MSDHLSELQNIFLAGFIKSQDLKDHGNLLSLEPLINIINEMEINGVYVRCSDSNKEVKIRFILGLVMGDNLGVNSICDFRTTVRGQKLNNTG